MEAWTRNVARVTATIVASAMKESSATLYSGMR